MGTGIRAGCCDRPILTGGGSQELRRGVLRLIHRPIAAKCAEVPQGRSVGTAGRWDEHGAATFPACQLGGNPVHGSQCRYRNILHGGAG